MASNEIDKSPTAKPSPAVDPATAAGITRSGSLPPPAAPPSPPWQTWLPWALAMCFAVLCVVLIGQSVWIRHRTARLNQQVEDLIQQSTTLRSERTQMVQALQEVTNLQQRMLDLQKQLVQQGVNFSRQKSTLDEQHKQKTTELQQQSEAWKRKFNEQLNDNASLKAAVQTLTLAARDRLTQLRVTPMRPTEDGPPKAIGAALWDPQEQRGLLHVESLAGLAPSLAYQLWLYDPSFPTPVNGGTFAVDERGNQRYPFKPNERLENLEKFAVSIERKGGATAPRGKFVLVSN